VGEGNTIFESKREVKVKALADISRSVLCCHSNQTRARIANPPYSAQLEGTHTIPQLTSGSVQ